MRIVQVVVEGSSEFEKKCQRVDFAELSKTHEIVVIDSPRNAPKADVAHIYGQPTDLIGFSTPYVASSAPRTPRLAWRKPPQPVAFVGPDDVPEAVEEEFFVWRPAPSPVVASEGARRHTIGSFRRPSIRNIIEQTVVRLSRFRDDVEWKLFEHIPSPTDLAGVDLWADPTGDENDQDGFVAEALVAGKVVVATRSKMNLQRTEKGRSAFLVPREDPNELTHAILAALFKPEVAQQKIEAARQTAGKFRPRQRSRVLERIYETVIR